MQFLAGFVVGLFYLLSAFWCYRTVRHAVTTDFHRYTVGDRVFALIFSSLPILNFLTAAAMSFCYNEWKWPQKEAKW